MRNFNIMHFKNLIKHKSRYLFQNQSSHETKNAYTILKEVGKITTNLNLIKKIEKDANHPEMILTESGIGYRFTLI